MATDDVIVQALIDQTSDIVAIVSGSKIAGRQRVTARRGETLDGVIRRTMGDSPFKEAFLRGVFLELNAGAFHTGTTRLLPESTLFVPNVADLRSHLTRVFFAPGEGRSLKAIGKPHTNRGVDAAGVKSEVLSRVKAWDNADYFDGLAGISAAMQVSVTGGRVKVYVPFRSVADFDRLDVIGTPA